MFCLLWIVFGLYNVQLSPFAAAAFSSLSHTAWALSLAWIVVACSSGYGGYVNKLLSLPLIYPFSRVTYCAYLVHPISIRFISLGSDATIHLGNDSMVSRCFIRDILRLDAPHSGLTFDVCLLVNSRWWSTSATWCCRTFWPSSFRCRSRLRW